MNPSKPVPEPTSATVVCPGTITRRSASWNASLRRRSARMVRWNSMSMARARLSGGGFCVGHGGGVTLAREGMRDQEPISARDEDGEVDQYRVNGAIVRIGEIEAAPLGVELLLVTPQTLVVVDCLLYTSPSPRDRQKSRM